MSQFTELRKPVMNESIFDQDSFWNLKFRMFTKESFRKNQTSIWLINENI